MDFETDFSSNSSDRSESLTTTDNESESAVQLDPWPPLIEEAKQRSNIAFEETKESLVDSGLDEESATKLAYSSILLKLQKELESVQMQRPMWMVIDTIDKRKFLIKGLLKDYNFSKESNDEDD